MEKAISNKMTVRELINFSKKQNLPRQKKDIQQIINDIDKDLWFKD